MRLDGYLPAGQYARAADKSHQLEQPYEPDDADCSQVLRLDNRGIDGPEHAAEVAEIEWEYLGYG